MSKNATTPSMRIEIAYALPEKQYLKRIKLPAGMTARQALAFSDIAEHYSDLDLQTCPLGVFGTAVTDDAVLNEGDRLEIYRALLKDPRSARRDRATGLG